MPTTEILKEYCINRYAKELQDKFESNNFRMTNPEANVYVLEIQQIYKRSIAWKLVVTYQVVEYDDSVLQLQDVSIFSENDVKELGITCTYNTTPKSLRYQWGEFVDVHASKPTNTGMFMLMQAFLSSDWIHETIFKTICRKVIRPVQKHTNMKPTSITAIKPIVERVNDIMQSI